MPALWHDPFFRVNVPRRSKHPRQMVLHAYRSATFSGVNPPARKTGRPNFCASTARSQLNFSPVPPGFPMSQSRAARRRWGISAAPSAIQHCGCGTLHAHHPKLRAKFRRFVAVKLEQAQAAFRDGPENKIHLAFTKTQRA